MWRHSSVKTFICQDLHCEIIHHPVTQQTLKGRCFLSLAILLCKCLLFYSFTEHFTRCPTHTVPFMCITLLSLHNNPMRPVLTLLRGRKTWGSGRLSNLPNTSQQRMWIQVKSKARVGPLGYHVVEVWTKQRSMENSDQLSRDIFKDKEEFTQQRLW